MQAPLSQGNSDGKLTTSKTADGFIATATPENIERGLHILRTLSAALTSRGFRKASYPEFWRKGIRFESHGMYCTFSIRERTIRRRRNDGTIAERKGILNLRMDSNYYNDQWHDTTRCKLDQRVDEILDSIISKAVRFESAQKEMEESARNRRHQVEEARKRETDIDFVVRLWPTLTESMRKGIVAMVRAVSGDA